MRLNGTYSGLVFTALLSLSCDLQPVPPPGAAAGTGSGAPSGAGAGTAGAKASGGAPASAGSVGSGGTSAAGSSGALNASGGASGASGANSAGGMSSGGGAAGAQAGSGTGGAQASGGAGGVPASGGAGTTIPGEKKPNVTAPASSKTSSDYFVLGETRLINNNWGAQSLGCKAPYEIFVNADKTFGWKWDRAGTTCGGNKSKPDYPEVEFGMHPFGLSKQLVTTPDYSSTTVLPIQIQDVTTASVSIDGLTMAASSDKAWNMNFEMWVCEQHPATGMHKTAYGETMNWLGWSSDQYDWNGVVGSLDAGQKFNMYLSRDAWPDGQAEQWKYRQYRLQSSTRQFSGSIDIKKILDHLTGSEGWPKSLWIARFEVGTELDDGSAGTVTMKNVTFEVNGQKRSTEVH